MIQLHNNHYQIGGIDIDTLCKTYDTPIYVYDTAIIKRQYETLTKAFASCNTRIKFACKALNNINILRYFKQLGAGLDTVSIQEVWVGLKAGFEPHEIIYTPNCVSMEEIELAVQAGVQINIDNLSVLEQFGTKYGSTIPVCIRINPHVMAGGNINISTGHIDSKFGISIYQMRHAERIVNSLKMHVNGLHMHTGSDIVDVDIFLRAADILFEQTQYFKDLEFIDFGSGFKVPYKPDDYYTDMQELGEKLSKRFLEFCKEYGRDLQLSFEPGKFLVSQCGTFLVKVNVLKQTTAAMFVGVDSGLNHLIRPMFYNAYHHITNVSNPGGKERIYTVVGYICETDTFGWDRKLSEVHEGDILAFSNAGAYGNTMASNYNSRFRPAEVMVHEGKHYLIRKRENIDDLLRNQVELEEFK
ncbi:MAG: diaminopimelate decarboxylase [Chitinophagales bacterium]|nr:diaminopimelate decarboxylase [Chitinophagales bacterium]MCO5279664.1 diaminopimelate decarboxylase [Chitinophagales bacterium]OJV29135.1 MAG: diaminopimelate decarboxylase [Bacteroidetes bacterium 37-13]HRN93087.1 diaminopimelate decarboxylase [Chitinophagales bacterium]HRP39817.1 diaminopimelate decarboxylase [Chitinophagales bacterium]